VPVITYVPKFLKTCVAVAVPDTWPRSWVVPSPQFTERSRTALPFAAAAVTAKVKVAGNPTLGGVDGGVITRFGEAATPTVTVADACPEVLPVAGAAGVAGGAVPLAAAAPTLAVTVAVCDVRSVVCARPL
jgi:hypothetical protein